MNLAKVLAVIQQHPDWPNVSTPALKVWGDADSGQTEDIATLAASTVLSVVMDNIAEWQAMSTADHDLFWNILTVCSSDGVPTDTDSPIRARLVAILGTATKQALGALIPQPVNRWQAGDIQVTVREGDIEEARA